MAAPIHEVGPLTATIGGLIAFVGFIGAVRLADGYRNSTEEQRNGRVARAIMRSVPTFKRIGWVGVAVAVVGLLIWGITAIA